MPKPDKDQLMIQISAMLNNMKPEELEKVLEKLQHPDQEEEGSEGGEGKEGKEGEEKKGGEQKAGAGQQPRKPGESQQGQAVHEYGKK